MGVSNGQCCNICVTTRAYSNEGKQLWKNSFDTDTIDMFVYSGDTHLIGNDSLSFQYLNEISPIGTGVKQKYIIPFQTNVTNLNNYRKISDKNRFIQKENNEIVSYSKSLGYIDSFSFVNYSGNSSTNQSDIMTNKHSYPYELYKDNTENARIFANEKSLFIVKYDKIYEYKTTGEHTELSNISFFNKNILNPSFDGKIIYVGEKTYNYGNIEFNQHTNFISGIPNNNTTDDINICFNYPLQYYPTGFFAGYSANIQYKSNKFNDYLLFKFDKSGADIFIENSSCYPAYNRVANDDYWWMSSGYLDENSKRMYDNNSYSCESVYYSGWMVKNVSVGISDVKVNMIKLHDTISSGDLYYKYDMSTFNGPIIPSVGSGYVATWIGEYDIDTRKTTEKQINVNSIINQNYLLNHFTYVSGYTQDFMFGFYGFDSGNIIRKNKVVGDWRIINYDYNIQRRSNDSYLIALSPNILMRDFSYDSAFNEPSGIGYSFMRNSFYLAKHSVTYPQTLDITCTEDRYEYQTGIFGNRAIYFLSSNFAPGSMTTESSYDKEASYGPISNWNFDIISWSLHSTFKLADYDICLQIQNVAYFWNLHTSPLTDGFTLYSVTGGYDFPQYMSFDYTVGNATTFLEFYVPSDLASEPNVIAPNVGTEIVWSGGLRDYIFPNYANFGGFGGISEINPYTNCVVFDRDGNKLGCTETGVIVPSINYWMFEPVYSGIPNLSTISNLCYPCLTPIAKRWFATYHYNAPTVYTLGDGCGGSATGVDFFSRSECGGPPYVTGDIYAKLPILVVDGYPVHIPPTGYITLINNDNCSITEFNCSQLSNEIVFCPYIGGAVFAHSGNFIGPGLGYRKFIAGRATNYNIPQNSQGYAPYAISYTKIYKHPFESESARIWPYNIGMSSNNIQGGLGEFESKRLYSINVGGVYTTGENSSFGPVNFGKLDYSTPEGLFDGTLRFESIFYPYLADNILPIKAKIIREGSWRLSSPSVTYNHTSGEFRGNTYLGSGYDAAFGSNKVENLYGIIKDSGLYVLENRYKHNYV